MNPEQQPNEHETGSVDLTGSAEHFLQEHGGNTQDASHAAIESILADYDRGTETKLAEFDADLETFDDPADAVLRQEMDMASVAGEVERAGLPDEDNSNTATVGEVDPEQGGMTNPFHGLVQNRRVRNFLAAAVVATGLMSAPKDAEAGERGEGASVLAGIILGKPLMRGLERVNDRKDVLEVERQRDLQESRALNQMESQMRMIDLQEEMRYDERDRIESDTRLDERTRESRIANIDRQIENLDAQRQRARMSMEQQRINAEQQATNRHLQNADQRARIRNEYPGDSRYAGEVARYKENELNKLYAEHDRIGSDTRISEHARSERLDSVSREIGDLERELGVPPREEPASHARGGEGEEASGSHAGSKLGPQKAK